MFYIVKFIVPHESSTLNLKVQTYKGHRSPFETVTTLKRYTKISLLLLES